MQILKKGFAFLLTMGLILAVPFTSLAAKTQSQQTPILTTVEGNRLVNYTPTIIGENGATMQVVAVLAEHDIRGRRFKAGGILTTKDKKAPGMTTFYAEFYGANMELLARIPAYTKDPQDGDYVILEWHIPDGCTGIIVR